MIPIKPDIDVPEGWRYVVYAEDQKEYLPLPVIKENASPNHVISCWKLSWKERFQLLFSGNLWLTVLTFNQPLQPILLDCSQPKFNLEQNQ